MAAEVGGDVPGCCHRIAAKNPCAWPQLLLQSFKADKLKDGEGRPEGRPVWLGNAMIWHNRSIGCVYEFLPDNLSYRLLVDLFSTSTC
jgi:hypothetical protein